MRGDTLNPPLLGMSGTVSEDVVRRAMKRMDERAGLAWLSGELRACIEPVLRVPWVLDIDCTVKPLYGHQQGAQIGYNPHKPGRPSHCYHSYFMAGVRLCLGVEVCGGKEHAARHGLPGLWSLLDALPRTHWPAFIRGDCAYGNEQLLVEAEARAVPCFFKLKHTPKVKVLVAQMTRAGSRWQPAGDGWEVLESSLRLSGWSRERRVVLVRESPAIAPIGEHARRRRDHSQPMLPETRGWVGGPAPWAGKIAVLVTTLDASAYPAEALARLYRERADAENIYDELKNQWGWNGLPGASAPALRAAYRQAISLRSIHHAKARPHAADGQPHRAGLQLVELLRAALRQRTPPRSHVCRILERKISGTISAAPRFQPARAAERSRAAVAARRPAHRESQPPA